tara:strand:+ start:109 stop:399 length:291 start_codon:yes stop_codon:yes gene_type:complete
MKTQNTNSKITSKQTLRATFQIRIYEAQKNGNQLLIHEAKETGYNNSIDYAKDWIREMRKMDPELPLMYGFVKNSNLKLDNVVFELKHSLGSVNVI